MASRDPVPVEWGKVYKRNVSRSEQTIRLEHGAELILKPACITVDREKFEKVYDSLWSTIPATPNPRNPKTNLIRKQATIGKIPGGAYRFGKQVSTCIDHKSELLNACLSEVPSTHTVTHVNLYPGTASGDSTNGCLNWHDDYDGNLFFDHGSGIYSFSLYPTDDATRLFQVRSKQTPTNVIGIEVGQGDLVVMKGENFQKNYEHCAPVSRTKKGIVRRVNFTLRKPLF